MVLTKAIETVGHAGYLRRAARPVREARAALRIFEEGAVSAKDAETVKFNLYKPANFTHSDSRNQFKRASHVMSTILKMQNEQFHIKMACEGPDIQPFEVGDSVEVKYALDHSESNSPSSVLGVVMAKQRKDFKSSFSLINSLDGEYAVTRYPLGTPLLKSVRVIQKRFVTGGIKRPRRAKLNYLKEAPPRVYMITQNMVDEVYPPVRKAPKPDEQTKKKKK